MFMVVPSSNAILLTVTQNVKSNQTHLFRVARHFLWLEECNIFHLRSPFFSVSSGAIDNFQKKTRLFHTLLLCFMVLVSISLAPTSRSDAERCDVVSCDNSNCSSSFFAYTTHYTAVQFIITLVNRSDFYPYLGELYSNCIWHFLLNMLIYDVYQCHKCFTDPYPFSM